MHKRILHGYMYKGRVSNLEGGGGGRCVRGKTQKLGGSRGHARQRNYVI